MDQKAAIGSLKENYKVIIFFIVFAVAQFSFFWGLCHLMPGERYYQRKARIMASKAPPASILDPIKKSQVPNFETESTHKQQILDDLNRAGRLPQQPSAK